MSKQGLWLLVPLLVFSVLMGGEATGSLELEKAKTKGNMGSNFLNIFFKILFCFDIYYSNSIASVFHSNYCKCNLGNVAIRYFQL